jgi:hypothetical protein
MFLWRESNHGQWFCENSSCLVCPSGEHIWWKLTSSSCKLWKLQSESHDLDLRESSWDYGRWKGWFAKFMGGGRRDLQRWFCKSLLPPPLSAPLDQHRVTQIEVSIVCMERLVSTWYVVVHQLSWLLIKFVAATWLLFVIRSCNLMIWSTVLRSIFYNICTSLPFTFVYCLIWSYKDTTISAPNKSSSKGVFDRDGSKYQFRYHFLAVLFLF